MITNNIKRSFFQFPTLRDVGNKAQGILVMDCLRYRVDSVGRSLAQRAISVISQSLFSRDIDKSFDLFGIPGMKETEFSRTDAMVATAGMCSQVLFYGAFYSAVCSVVGPIEGWNSLALLLGPWWSSSYWMEWLGYDFIRSALSSDGQSSPIVDSINKWVPFKEHRELRYAYKHHKICFCLCAIAFLSVCAFVYQTRPAANNILMERSVAFFKDSLSSMPLTELNLSLQDSFYP